MHAVCLSHVSCNVRWRSRNSKHTKSKATLHRVNCSTNDSEYMAPCDKQIFARTCCEDSTNDEAGYEKFIRIKIVAHFGPQACCPANNSWCVASYLLGMVSFSLVVFVVSPLRVASYSSYESVDFLFLVSYISCIHTLSFLRGEYIE